MYEFLRSLHLFSILPCVPLGFYLLLFSSKGGKVHRLLGKVYMGLIFFSSFISLFLEAKVGHQFLNHFGWIHLLSLLTLWTVPYSFYTIKKGNVKSHQRYMVFLYWTCLLIAGVFTLSPGRYLHGVLFN